MLEFNCMDTDSQIPIGDLSGNDTDLSVPTRSMVEQRAREIARLAERDPDKFSEEDWEQARAELTGRQASAKHDPGEIAASLSERDSIPGQTGSRAPRLSPKDEALLNEQLANRGVEEAAHDQTVEAAKSNQKQEG